jgi:hypothetical protein
VGMWSDLWPETPRAEGSGGPTASAPGSCFCLPRLNLRQTLDARPPSSKS